MGFMKQYETQTYALLRIVSGFLFIFHGIPKMQAIMAGEASWMYYLAGPIEVIGGVLIMIGLCTSAAAFLSSGLMAGAYWLIHFSKMGGGLPINNKGDAVLASVRRFSNREIYVDTPGITLAFSTVASERSNSRATGSTSVEQVIAMSGSAARKSSTTRTSCTEFA